MKTATILLKRDEQEKIKDKVTRILENYENFVLVEVTDEQIQSLQKEGFKVVVRSEIDNIKLGTVTINTTSLRYDKQGAIQAHPAYEHTKDSGPGMHHYIVQFIGPTKEEWKEEINKLGGILCDPLPSFSYMVEMNGQTRDKVVKLPFVRWLGHYDTSYRLSPELLDEITEAQRVLTQPRAAAKEAVGKPIMSKKAPPVPNTFSVSFQTKENLNQAQQKIRSEGAKITSVSESSKTLTVSFLPETPQLADKLKKLAAIHGVRSIDALRIRQLRNNIATRIMADSLGSPDLNLPLTGEGEIIAVADTGIDTGDSSTIHEDFRGRIEEIKSWPIQPAFNDYVNNPGGDDGAADVDSGHGTHVSGSVLGNGKKSQGVIRGFANNARIFFQSIEQKLDWKDDRYRKEYGEYLLAGLPDDLTKLFLQAYQGGARIHTNSWGGGTAGSYDDQCLAVDRFVWENKDMVILFAAGNDGRDEDRTGKVKEGSITPPATAKNCISVAATENLREEFTDTYRDWWNWDFPKDPIGSDKIADNPDDVAAFSSRGPCKDGRFKPDVAAPGTFILSTRSSQANGAEGKGWGLLPDNDPKKPNYLYMGGTSMATPLTAGAVALIRQYLRKKGLNPKASLVKAALIHAAVKKPYRYTAVSSPAPWDFEQGYGRVNLKPFISDLEGLKMKFIDGEAIATGELKEYTFEVKDTSFPFKATLAYTDYPGTSIINNLNLIVTTPNGKDYHGNQFAPPFDAAFDPGNNVETIYIQEPIAGQYKVTVLASDVVEGPQDYSLVVSGGFEEKDYGKITGKVVNKITNEPIEDAKVSADTSQSTSTDANGNYEFIVSVGDRKITAHKAGYLDASTNVTVEKDKEVPAANLELEKPDVMSITGKVVDKLTGKPLEGVEVSTDTGQSTKTDADGNYELGKVPVGECSITALKEGCKCACTIVTVEEGKVVTAKTLELFCHEEVIYVPDVVTRTQAEAEDILKNAGLAVGEVTKKVSPKTPPDTVLKQNPAAGTKVPVGSPVNLVIAIPNGPKEIPNVVVMTLAEAKDVLKRANIPLTTWYRRISTKPLCTVLAQEPAAGTKVSEGLSVRLWVAASKNDPYVRC